eukprot:GCRY01002655.1.p1 GENE.GCRY01002655.1~~GCRY01002655.1.p1  ORF type:complete len:188 (-),score=58.18 GCRY01002655.1:24-587(-)
MARASTRKRRKTGNVVRRKAKKVLPKPDFQVDLIKEKWDMKKTLKQNYEELGLELSGNEVTAVNHEVVSFITPEELQKMKSGSEVGYDPILDRKIKKAPAKNQFIKDLEKLASKEIVRREWMSEGDIVLAEKLLAKYPNKDYKKMARDAKINYLQLTPKQIEKKVERYLAIKEEAEKLLEEEEQKQS